MKLNSQLNQKLHEGFKIMGLTASPEQEFALLSYMNLLAEWNRVYNLTAITNPEEMLIKHIFDSVIILPFIIGQNILDVGTGAGLPGIPLAIMLPHHHFVLLDSNKKKTRFLTHVQHQLSLNNVTIVDNRLQAFTYEPGFDTIVSRAFSSLKEFLINSRHLLKKEGQFLAMKGNNPVSELHEIPEDYKVSGVHRLLVPGLSAERHIVCVSL